LPENTLTLSEIVGKLLEIAANLEIVGKLYAVSYELASRFIFACPPREECEGTIEILWYLNL